MFQNIGYAFIFGGAILSAIGGIIVSIKSTTQLEAARKELAMKNDFILSTITGGDSYCVLKLYVDETGNSGQWFVRHEGKYPLYDVQVSFVDLDAMSTKKIETIKDAISTRNTITLGNISPRHATLLSQLDLTNKSKLSYNIFISARSGYFVENLRMFKIKNKWLSAIRVEPGYGEKDTVSVLYEKIDPDYPKPESGKIFD